MRAVKMAMCLGGNITNEEKVMAVRAGEGVGEDIIALK